MTGIGRYFKAAFWNRWNLLALAGGVGIAALSGGQADVLGALVLAAEAAYLAFRLKIDQVGNRRIKISQCAAKQKVL